MAVLMVASLAACAQQTKTETTEEPAATEEAVTTEAPEAAATEEATKESLEAAELQLFIAASLEGVFQAIIPLYAESQPNVTITYNADSSGKLMTQIQEGFACDVFFSASKAKVDTLDKEGLVVEGSRVNLLCNKLALITPKDSGTAVTGFADIASAENMALADGSVPAGKYARQVLITLGILDGSKAAADYTTEEISAALGGLEINACSNVSKVKEAIKEGSNEIGAVYYSDAYSIKDDIDILEIADSSLTGDILYPVCLIENPQATEAETAAAEDFVAFLQTDAVKALFGDYMFTIYE